MNNAGKIQVVINTLGQIKIDATKENTNKILGIYMMLEEVQKDLIAEEEKAHGKADTK